MRHLTRTLRYATLGATALIVGTCWLTPLGAETESVQPTRREIIEKRSKTPTEEREAPGIPDDPLGRGTPRSSVRGFLGAAKDRNYVQAAEYLDLRNLPSGLTESQGPELARQLRIVLDRTLWIDVELLSTNPEGEPSDNLPVVRERVGRIAAEGKTYDLLLQRVPRGDGVYIWKFSDATVAEIPERYQQFGYGQLERIVPAWMFDVAFLGINLWLWAAVIGLGILLYPVAMLVTRVVAAALRLFNAEFADQF